MGQRYEYGATCEPFNRTCPRYYFESEFFQIIFQDVQDYRRGAMGNVCDLPAAHLDLLRVLDAELDNWENLQDTRLYEEALKNG